jgi:hypothetical protein
MVRDFYNTMFAYYGTGAEEAIRFAITNTEEVFKYIPQKTTLVVAMTSGDTSVPSEYQKKLIYLIIPQELVLLNYKKWIAKLFKMFENGHYQALLYYPYLIYRSIKFLAKEN